ncbi:hypothetical protein, partial [Egicoccus sp. AB-alg2]
MLALLALILGAITALLGGFPTIAAALAFAAVALMPAPIKGVRSRFDLAAQTGDISSFVPEFWIRELLRKLRHAHIFGQPNVANRNYQGTISQAGDTVTINQVGEVTIKDYERDDIDPPEELSTEARQLLIDQEKYFNFMVDDVDAAQAAGSVMDGGMESAAFQLRDVADRHLASFHADAAAANRIGTDVDPVSISDPAHAYFYLNRLALKLDNAGVPSEGRYAVLPTWFASLLSLDKRFTSAGDYGGGNSPLLNGEVGRAAGFNLLTSRNAPSGTDGVDTDNDKVIAGHPMALSFAEQINKVEAYRPERRFGDAVKGLHVYGAKLVYPEAWAVGSFVDGV